MAVETWLADEDLRPSTELLLKARDLLAQLIDLLGPAERRRLAHTGRRAVAAEDLAQRARPLAGGGACASRGDRRDHQVLAGALITRDGGQLAERRIDRLLIAL